MAEVTELNEAETDEVNGACGDGNNSDLADTIRDVSDYVKGFVKGLFG